MSLTALPVELQLAIICFLEPTDQKALSSTCQSFYRLLLDQEKKALQDFQKKALSIIEEPHFWSKTYPKPLKMNLGTTDYTQDFTKKELEEEKDKLFDEFFTIFSKNVFGISAPLVGYRARILAEFTVQPAIRGEYQKALDEHLANHLNTTNFIQLVGGPNPIAEVFLKRLIVGISHQEKEIYLNISGFTLTDEQLKLVRSIQNLPTVAHIKITSSRQRKVITR